ncbi:hypothetical protein [Pyrobaculum aerophilum]|uniref:hypothetical protein n=1 Tax=Pyrobaculum aerophilum TaxID=13773 RepID=UPI0011C01FDF|nr:hypothetical protein [Pyrobaculum aerophilum]
MSETNLGVVKMRGGKDGYIITNEYWSYLANGFREMGLLVRTLPEEKAFVMKKLDIMSVRLITSYSATYPYTATLEEIRQRDGDCPNSAPSRRLLFCRPLEHIRRRCGGREGPPGIRRVAREIRGAEF